VPLEQLSDWIGRNETRCDEITAPPLARLAALLNHTDPSPWQEGSLPPLAHWLYGLPAVPQAQLSDDGHPKLGQFLPPISLPRRMWAAGSVEFLHPIRIGDSIRKYSVIEAIEEKKGRSGDLVFVKLRHDVHSPAGLALRETQEIVYRNEPAASKASLESATEDPLPIADWTRTLWPDPMLLFRFSAATFNSHRIHYDRDYAVGVEGYPGLVVQGPLIAILLMDLFLKNHPGAQIMSFRFRAQRPLFDFQPLTVCGIKRDAGAELWALNANRQIAMHAKLSHG
jgi:3-methylfumaryl-CoA hydratase